MIHIWFKSEFCLCCMFEDTQDCNLLPKLPINFSFTGLLSLQGEFFSVRDCDERIKVWHFSTAFDRHFVQAIPAPFHP